MFIMKTTIVLLSLVLNVIGVPVTTIDEENQVQYLLVETAPGIYAVENLTGPVPHLEVSKSDVKLYFASQAHSDPILVDLDQPDTIKNCFSTEKETLFLIHGWQNDYDSSVNCEIPKAILEVKDVNIFIVDWSRIARLTYLIAFTAVPGVGQIVGQMIQSLIGNYGLDLSTTSIVGHSLGAHVAGRAGAALNGEIPVIVGLDPAGPLFFYHKTDNRLDVSDAKFVHVIHTCGNILGFQRPIGHADYYPNGGDSQPGCFLDVAGSCAHGRAYSYYAESVLSGGFAARKCDSFNDYKHGKCDGNEISMMGQDPVDVTASGTYYLKTNTQAPYAEGDQ